ncbi:Bromodomain protein, partial [Teladorsagia circumcincta]
SANSFMKSGCSGSIEELKEKIFCCERRINRDFLRPSFFVGEKKCLAYSMEMNGENLKKEDDEDDRDDADKDDEDSERDELESSQMVERWRAYVESAETPAKLSLAIQSPPSREWFCPACVETSTQVPTCLVCSQQHDYLTPCRKCYHFFHAECVADVSYEYDFMCRGCDPKLFERRVIAHGESDDLVEADDSTDPSDHHHHHHPHQNHSHHPVQNKDSRKALKRKADAPPPVVFPTDMNNDLCRAMLDELECQPGVGPFLEPVDLDLVPGYRGTTKLENPNSELIKTILFSYETPEDFAADMELMFSNCRTFNEDDSPVGMAGANLHKFYHKRWRQLKYNFSKRLKRMRHTV